MRFKNEIFIYWKSIIALLIIMLGIVFHWQWIWGIFFLLWVANDLKNHSTYLLNYIEKSKAPLLYWLIISMWLFLSFYSLFLALSRQGKVDAQTYYPMSNKQFNFSLQFPRSWNFKQKSTSKNITIHFYDNQLTEVATIMAMKLQQKISLQDYIFYMQTEIAKQLPFIKTSRAINLELQNKSPIVFYKYSGNYQGYPVTAVIGYKVKGNHGFNLFAMYADGDKATQAQIYKVYCSFKLK